MTLSATPLTAVSTFTAAVYPPEATTDVLAADVAAGEQNLLNRTEALADGYLTPPGATWRSVCTSPIAAIDNVSWSATIKGMLTDLVATGIALAQPLDPPHGSLLDGVIVLIDPANTHGATLPATPPAIQVWKVNMLTGSATNSGASVPDPQGTATVAAYQAIHAFGHLAFLAETIDRETYRYGVTFTSESGAGSQVNLLYIGAQMLIDATARDPLAG